MEWRHANVSARLIDFDKIVTTVTFCSVFLSLRLPPFPSFNNMSRLTLQQPQSVPHAANALSSRNPGKIVAVVAEVLGSKNVVLLPLATKRLSTRGTRAFGLANHEDMSRQTWANSWSLLNKTAMTAPSAIMMAL